MYFEDTDLCERLSAAGWDIVYAPSATVVHHGGHATSRNLDAMSKAHHDSAWYLSRRYAGRRWAPVRVSCGPGSGVGTSSPAGYAAWCTARSRRGTPDLCGPIRVPAAMSCLVPRTGAGKDGRGASHAPAHRRPHPRLRPAAHRTQPAERRGRRPARPASETEADGRPPFSKRVIGPSAPRRMAAALRQEVAELRPAESAYRLFQATSTRRSGPSRTCASRPTSSSTGLVMCPASTYASANRWRCSTSLAPRWRGGRRRRSGAPRVALPDGQRLLRLDRLAAVVCPSRDPPAAPVVEVGSGWSTALLLDACDREGLRRR